MNPGCSRWSSSGPACVKHTLAMQSSRSRRYQQTQEQMRAALSGIIGELCSKLILHTEKLMSLRLKPARWVAGERSQNSWRRSTKKSERDRIWGWRTSAHRRRIRSSATKKHEQEASRQQAVRMTLTRRRSDRRKSHEEAEVRGASWILEATCSLTDRATPEA